MPERTEPALATASDYGIDVGRVVAMRAAVEEVVAKVLREGEHYGAIPGTTQLGKKPKKVLLQPGAEVLCQVFRLRPEYVVETRQEAPDFILREVRCKLYNSVTGEQVGEAIGSANSREEKYLVQTAARLCPACGKATIIKGKDDYGGGWLCFAKKGGCGAKYSDEDKKILDQTGTVSGDKVYNLHHTVISIAQKRAYVKAVRNATATSDIFTDEDAPVEDDEGPGHLWNPPSPRTQPQAKAGGAKASAVQVRDLNTALMAGHVGTDFPPETSEEARRDQGRKARLAWVNQMLEDVELPAVIGMSELAPDIADRLIKAARAGQVPKGW